MNPNSNPPQSNQPPQPEFTQKALDTKFSYAWTRKHCIILFNVLNSLQMKLGDLDTLGMNVLNEIRTEIQRTAIQSITPDDYVKPTNHVDAVITPPVEEVKTN